MRIEWSEEKNEFLKKERGISFEDVLVKISEGNYLDIIPHPNKEKYAHQFILIILLREYIYLIPFVQKEEVIFLKTIIPSRKFTKLYKNKNNGNN